jgi:hypothetical protein
MTNLDITRFPRFQERSVDRTKREYCSTDNISPELYAARARCTPGDPTYDETLGNELYRRYGTTRDSDAFQPQPAILPLYHATADASDLATRTDANDDANDLAAQTESQLSLESGRRSPKRPHAPTPPPHAAKRPRGDANDDASSTTRSPPPSPILLSDHEDEQMGATGELSQNVPYGMIIPAPLFVCVTDIKGFLAYFTTDESIEVSPCTFRTHNHAFLIRSDPSVIDNLATTTANQPLFNRPCAPILLNAGMWADIRHKPFDDHANALAYSPMVHSCKGRCPPDKEAVLAEIIASSNSELEVVTKFFAAVPSANATASFP